MSRIVTAEPRRGTDPAEGGYLLRVGERVRLMRAQRGMSRKVLSQASGVSERYLAELERGAGNASLLVIRQIATAMGAPIAELVSGEPERSMDLKLAISQLERLSADELRDARELLSQRFGRPGLSKAGRVALIGLRGAGKTTLGQAAAKALEIPFVELDREVERAAGMDLAEIFSLRGRAVFRQLELQCLEHVIATHERVIIAAGGSLVTEPATFDLLLASCYVVWLRATPEQHMQRVAAQGDMRPMAASRQAMDDLEAILDSRAALYARANDALDTSHMDEAQAVAALIAMLDGRRA